MISHQSRTHAFNKTDQPGDRSPGKSPAEIVLVTLYRGAVITMVWSQIILPRADVRCGKIFHKDRVSAQGHRVALEIWYQATGGAREGCQLAVRRCKRCGGFHISWKRESAGRPLDQPDPRVDQPVFTDDFEAEESEDDFDNHDRPPAMPNLDSFPRHGVLESAARPYHLGGAAQ